MTILHTVELEYPQAILVQGVSSWRTIVGLGDSPCVPKVKLTICLTTKNKGVEMSIAQAKELSDSLTAAIAEAEQVTESRNQYLAQNGPLARKGAP